MLHFVIRDRQLGEHALGTGGQHNLRVGKSVNRVGLGRQGSKKLVGNVKFFIGNYLFIKFSGAIGNVLAATCFEVCLDVLKLGLESVRGRHCGHRVVLHDLGVVVLLLHDDLDGACIGVVAFLVAGKAGDVEVLVQGGRVLMQDTFQLSLGDLFFLAIAGLVPFDTTTMADDFVFHPVPHHVRIVC